MKETVIFFQELFVAHTFERYQVITNFFNAANSNSTRNNPAETSGQNERRVVLVMTWSSGSFSRSSPLVMIEKYSQEIKKKYSKLQINPMSQKCHKLPMVSIIPPVAIL